MIFTCFKALRLLFLTVVPQEAAIVSKYNSKYLTPENYENIG